MIVLSICLLSYCDFRVVGPGSSLNVVALDNIPMFYRANVTVGVKEDRLMMTGLHTVADIFCVKCGSIVGWTYETAHEEDQKYKEGKSVLERYKVSGPDGSNYWVRHETHIISGGEEEQV
ncbi:putative Yippee family protein [Helianthus annuus]|nr:putative Yippee family protein [Helianthus annuus]